MIDTGSVNSRNLLQIRITSWFTVLNNFITNRVTTKSKDFLLNFLPPGCPWGQICSPCLGFEPWGCCKSYRHHNTNS